LDPVVAAFFAASPLFRDRVDASITVWALNTAELFAYGSQPRSFGRFRIWVHNPARAENQFLHSQGGVLTEMLGVEDFFYQHDRWPSMEDLLGKVESSAPILVGLKLDSEHVARLLLLLEREGVNAARLMPTLDNVARTVISRWSSEA
jgi:hypothetical protein